MFSSGDKVIINSKGVCNGCAGIVVGRWVQTGYVNCYKVKVRCERPYINTTICVKGKNLMRKESEENNMAKLTGYNLVAVVKQGYGNYHFAIYNDGHDYKTGDKILVTGFNSGVLTIDEVITPEEAKARYPKDITSEVITYVDMTTYEKRLENRKAAKELKNKMDIEIKKMNETEKYAMYAAKNPDLAKMLDEYRNLVGC